MPRIGLPARPSKPKSSGGSSSVSAVAQLRVALGATAFRAVSALVASFAAVLVARSTTPAEPSTFGLYPILTHLVDRWLGRWLASPVDAALVVAWLAFAGGMAMLLRVAALDLDGDQAEVAVMLAVVFPFASLFGHHDADALFLLAALGAFWGFRQQNWIVGGLCGAIATASIPSGILILPALAWTGFRNPGAKRLWVAIALLLTAAGFGAYLSYMYYLAGPPGGWSGAMGRWGFQMGQAPWLSLQRLFTSHASAADTLNGAVTLIALATVPFVWWKLDGGYAIYMLAMLWLPLTSGRYDGLGRTCALLFPQFVLAARIPWRIVFIGLAIVSAIFYALVLATLA
jgi:hypothetical protein